MSDEPLPTAAPARLLAGVPVLVVEDDPANLKLAGVLLEQAGAEVRLAADAEEALRLLPTFSPRVVVVDLVLPHMSGLTLIERIKEMTFPFPVGLVAVTSFSGGPQLERMVDAAGGATCLTKPIDPLLFARVVASVLEHRP